MSRQQDRRLTPRVLVTSPPQSGNDLIRIQADQEFRCPMCRAEFKVFMVNGEPVSADLDLSAIGRGDFVEAEMIHESWCDATLDERETR